MRVGRAYRLSVAAAVLLGAGSAALGGRAAGPQGLIVFASAPADDINPQTSRREEAPFRCVDPRRAPALDEPGGWKCAPAPGAARRRRELVARRSTRCLRRPEQLRAEGRRRR